MKIKKYLKPIGLVILLLSIMFAAAEYIELAKLLSGVSMGLFLGLFFSGE